MTRPQVSFARSYRARSTASIRSTFAMHRASSVWETATQEPSAPKGLTESGIPKGHSPSSSISAAIIASSSNAVLRVFFIKLSKDFDLEGTMPVKFGHVKTKRSHQVNPQVKAAATSKLDDDYQDISTAPRDGTVIEVMDPDCGAFPMRWNPDGFNALFSISEGIWECPGKNFTWSEDGGYGPTKWRPHKPERYLS